MISQSCQHSHRRRLAHLCPTACLREDASRRKHLDRVADGRGGGRKERRGGCGTKKSAVRSASLQNVVNGRAEGLFARWLRDAQVVNSPATLRNAGQWHTAEQVYPCVPTGATPNQSVLTLNQAVLNPTRAKILTKPPSQSRKPDQKHKKGHNDFLPERRLGADLPQRG